jgi:hypothetical protein
MPTSTTWRDEQQRHPKRGAERPSRCLTDWFWITLPIIGTARRHEVGDGEHPIEGMKTSITPATIRPRGGTITDENAWTGPAEIEPLRRALGPASTPRRWAGSRRAGTSDEPITTAVGV